MLNSKCRNCFKVVALSNCASAALLVLRLIAGIAFMYHGWGKIQAPFGWMPAEAGIPGFLQFLAAVAEFGGGLAWVLGLLMPLASFGLFCTMTVATVMHMFIFKDPFVATGPGMSSYEPALVYWGVALVFLAIGPGKFSIDSKLFGNRT